MTSGAGVRAGPFFVFVKPLCLGVEKNSPQRHKGLTETKRNHMLRGLTVAAFLLASGAAFADDIADKAAVCAACHGDNGVPTDKAIPVL
jgi:cytochrome c553